MRDWLARFREFIRSCEEVAMLLFGFVMLLLTLRPIWKGHL
jgi:hypothetical protein